MSNCLASAIITHSFFCSYRKKSAPIRVSGLAWELRTYPAQLPEAKHKNMTRADVVFGVSGFQKSADPQFADKNWHEKP